MKRGVLTLLLGFFLAYIGIMGYIYLTQEAQIFNLKAIEPYEKIQEVGIESLRLEVQGATLEGVRRPALEPNAPLLFYFGGNANDATRFTQYAKALKGYEIICFNYRGYGKSSGEPSEKVLFEDALLIYDTYAKDNSVVLVGRSLGSGVASYVASKRKVQGLVLITPYDSISSMAKEKYPFLPIDFLLKHTFNSLQYISSVRASVAVIEVTNDTTIPRFHLERLLEAMPHKPYHVSLTHTTHGKVLSHPDFTAHLQNILGKFYE